MWRGSAGLRFHITNRVTGSLWSMLGFPPRALYLHSMAVLHNAFVM